MMRALGFVTLAYWTSFWTCLLFDMYLTEEVFGMVVRLLFPVAVLINLAGIVAGTLALKRKDGTLMRKLGDLALHFLPLLTAGSFCYWVAFGSWM